MARPLRLEYAVELYHVTSRGNAWQRIFRGDHDRETFLDIFAQVIKRFGWLCHVSCFSRNWTKPRERLAYLPVRLPRRGGRQVTAKEVLITTKQRRTFTAEEKAAILRCHLLDGVAVSDLCDEQGLNPTVFYHWQKVFFENATAAFERRKDSSARERKLAQKVEALTARLARKDEVIGEIMADHVRLKKSWGRMKGAGVEPDLRDEVCDCVREWSEKTEIPAMRLVQGLSRSKYYDWRWRYGQVNEHNAWVPRDHWLENWEKEAIIAYALDHRDGGYRLTYMMMDEDIVVASASSVYRVLNGTGLLGRWNRTPSKKGTGFQQPLKPHEHWHTDISYINIRATFYYLCSVLDGFGWYIVHWEIRETMTEADVEIVLQRARERFSAAALRIISDNGPQFIARDFKEFIRLSGMTHVRTSPFYPQSNGKQER